MGPLVAGIAMSLSSSLTMVLLMRKLEKVIGGAKHLQSMGQNSLLVLCIHWVESSQIDWLAVPRPIASIFGELVIGCIHLAVVVLIAGLVLSSRPSLRQ